jgi:hypothetical protein
MGQGAANLSAANKSDFLARHDNPHTNCGRYLAGQGRHGKAAKRSA